MSQIIELGDKVRQRCYECFRPLSLCFCDAIPQIDNRTNVLILQHVGERFHPFNTARIVRKALRNCHLIVDNNQRLAAQRLPLQADAGLLYPQANAPVLSDLAAAERPSQLVVIDGTWHQAKTIFRDVPELHKLPCYRLAPTTPGQYRIRREPDAQSLSTLEATASALKTLEPDTIGLDGLLTAFNQMVENQLERSAGHAAWRQNQSRKSGPRYIPSALLQNPDRLVVAYGESSPGQSGKRKAAPPPVSWVARRLGTKDRFTCLLRQPQPLSTTALKHMRLSTEDFDAALSPEEFCRRWYQFLRPNDVLIVYHQRTFQLLKNAGAAQPRCLVLKSIFGKWLSGFHSLEELIENEGVMLPTFKDNSRAAERLGMAVAMVEHIRTSHL